MVAASSARQGDGYRAGSRGGSDGLGAGVVGSAGHRADGDAVEDGQLDGDGAGGRGAGEADGDDAPCSRLGDGKGYAVGGAGPGCDVVAVRDVADGNRLA